MPPRTTRKSYRPRVSDRTMVGNLTTHTACWHRKPKRVVTISDEFAIRKDQNLPTLRGLERTRTPLLLPVAGEIFFLDSPLYRTALPPTWVLGANFRFWQSGLGEIQ